MHQSITKKFSFHFFSPFLMRKKVFGRHINIFFQSFNLGDGGFGFKTIL